MADYTDPRRINNQVYTMEDVSAYDRGMQAANSMPALQANR